MKQLILIWWLLLGVFATAQTYDAVFISEESLKTQLSDQDIIVLHVDPDNLYSRGHIAGAAQISSDDFTVRNEEIYYELPSVDDFAETLAKKGVTEDSKIIICSGWDSFEPAYRLYFTLDYFGLADQTRILDGGIRRWHEADNPISKDKAESTKTEALVLKEDETRLATKDWVLQNLNNPDVKLIDARIDAYYSGKSGQYERGGHIKGAGRVTWLDLVNEDHTLKPVNELRSLYEGAGVKNNITMTSYCHIGLRATVVYTVAKSLGYNVKMYDGSMNEWSQLSDEYPTERGY